MHARYGPPKGGCAVPRHNRVSYRGHRASPRRLTRAAQRVDDEKARCAMPTFRSAQVAEPGGRFHIVERETPEPARGQVRITVEGCGVCRTDAAFVNAAFPNVRFPLVTGHEIAGRIDAVGDDVEPWEPGQRVAVGWFGG